MKKEYLELTKELKEKGIRPTYQRVKLLEYFYEEGGHLTADDIYRELKPKLGAITKGTVYNNLKVFLANEIIMEVSIDDNEVRYEIKSKPHGHFKCVKCGAIYDFAVEMDNIPVGELSSFEIEEKNVYFKGICPNCLERGKSDE